MTTQPRKAAKRTKARVMYADPISLDLKYGMTIFPRKYRKLPKFTAPVVVIPCATKKQAALVCRLHSMSREQLLQIVSTAVYAQGSRSLVPSSILKALGLGGQPQ